MICMPSSIDLMWKKIGLHSVPPSLLPQRYCVEVLTPIHLHGCVISWCEGICIVKKNDRMKMSNGS